MNEYIKYSGIFLGGMISSSLIYFGIQNYLENKRMKNEIELLPKPMNTVISILHFRGEYNKKEIELLSGHKKSRLLKRVIEDEFCLISEWNSKSAFEEGIKGFKKIQILKIELYEDIEEEKEETSIYPQL